MSNNKTTIINGDCLKIMNSLPENTIDSVLCDPPYGLKFMGEKWDYGIPGSVFWESALNVSKPGSFMLAFGGTRTFHRLMCNIEDAGWKIIDCLMWTYSVGFPKGLNISKSIDKKAGLKRDIIGFNKTKSLQHIRTCGSYNGVRTYNYITQSVTDEAKHWEGYGTQLKPAWEPIVLCQKPLDGTFAENVLKYGTGVLNIDKCRVPLNGDDTSRKITTNPKTGNINFCSSKIVGSLNDRHNMGRYPANLLHDGSDEVVEIFPNNANRFFYCAKASTAERNYNGVNNDHPTVKPVKLLSYLARLITPPKGVILDPFAGSGSTGIAANEEGFDVILIDIDKHYCELAKQRNNVVDDIIIFN